MATSTLLKICPSCTSEISDPPPQQCSVCKSDLAWKRYQEKRREKVVSSLWANSPYRRPVSISEQGVIRTKPEGEFEYEECFRLLNFKEKEGVLSDALMIVRTLFTTNTPASEMHRLLSIAEKIGTLANAMTASLKAGAICCGKVDNDEPRPQVGQIPPNG